MTPRLADCVITLVTGGGFVLAGVAVYAAWCRMKGWES